MAESLHRQSAGSSIKVPMLNCLTFCEYIDRQVSFLKRHDTLVQVAIFVKPIPTYSLKFQCSRDS